MCPEVGFIRHAIIRIVVVFRAVGLKTEDLPAGLAGYISDRLKVSEFFIQVNEPDHRTSSTLGLQATHHSGGCPAVGPESPSTRQICILTGIWLSTGVYRNPGSQINLGPGMVETSSLLVEDSGLHLSRNPERPNQSRKQYGMLVAVPHLLMENLDRAGNRHHRPFFYFPVDPGSDSPDSLGSVLGPLHDTLGLGPDLGIVP
jgi:hypothetical protein